MSVNTSEPVLRVAIIGGGMTGLALAIGLQSRNVPFTVYERATSFREIGAGFGFSPNAERAMRALDPRIHDAFKRVATPNGEDYFQWVNGYTDELIYRLYLGKDCFQGCRRADFLEELVKLVPADRVRFNKQVEEIGEAQDGILTLKFKDGTNADADVVIGCDGIHSRVRQLMLGEHSASAYPGYTNKFCLRALVPMEKAKAALGAQRTSNKFMYNGPDAHATTYPVAMGEMLNVLAVITDRNHWRTNDGRHTAAGTKQEATLAFQTWHPTIRAIIDLFPDELDKWAIFDMLDNPAASYARGSVCVAGDAAHAAGPHLGAGAGFGVEDGLVLSTVLAAVQESGSRTPGQSRASLIRDALRVYSEVRYDRTQWLVKNTRTAVDLFQWQDPDCGSDAQVFAKEITWRFHRIWEYDISGMVWEARSRFLTSLE